LWVSQIAQELACSGEYCEAWQRTQSAPLPNQLAKPLVDIATGEKTDSQPSRESSNNRTSEVARLGGLDLREAEQGPISYPVRAAKRLRKQRLRLMEDSAAIPGGIRVALRDLALTLKNWAKNNQLMGPNYPEKPGFDASIIRTFFGPAGVPHVTRVLQDRQISYIGVNDISNEIIVYTKKKLSRGDQKILTGSTPTIGGQPVGIVFAHGGVAHAGGPPAPPIGIAPLHLHNGRYSCGGSIYIASEKGAGTLGCLVRSQDGTLFGLSNNHITGGCNYAVPGLPILAPGILDVAAGGQDPETIGHHHNSYPFVDGIPEIVPAEENLDAAIFKILDADRVSSRQRQHWDTPADCVPMEVGMRVAKVGRTTGLTHGEVTSELFDCEQVEYEVDVCGGKKYVYFKSLFIIHSPSGFFSQSGDSGSLVINIDKDGKHHAVGIIVGGDGLGLTFALSLDRALSYFNVELVSGHNA
jgi:hypothetical protein